MVDRKSITKLIKSEYPVTEYITKFGGQPNWIEKPEWPLSSGWDNRPMMFMAQIALDSSIFGNTTPKMAYVFVTHQESVDDNFFDPDIIEFDGGENAVILQPNGLYKGVVSCMSEGPSLFDSENSACEFIPHFETSKDPSFLNNIEYLKLSSSEKNDYFNSIDGNKIGGTPNLFQSDYMPEGEWKLLLQLNSSFLPFVLNLGASSTLFALVNSELTQGGLFIQDM